MNGYFGDLEWVGYNCLPECQAWVDKVFPDYWVVDYNHAGRIPLQIDDGPVIMLEGPVAWITYPGPRFRFGTRTGAWHHSHLSFRGNRVQRFIDSGLLQCDPLRPIIKVTEPARLLRSIMALVDYLDSPTYGEERSVLMLEDILLQLREQGDDGVPSHPSAPLFRALVASIKQRPEDHYDFQAVARDMHVSYTHFRRLFSEIAGYSPRQYVNHCRIVKACKLLREGRYEIKEIADRLGYTDIFHFNKQFKKQTGLPPGRYRTQSQRF